MTTLPATVFGMKDRGQLRAGAFADVLIFDLAKVNDAATYENPHQLAEGMTDIIVNGEVARRDGNVHDRAGRAACSGPSGSKLHVRGNSTSGSSCASSALHHVLVDARLRRPSALDDGAML